MTHTSEIIRKPVRIKRKAITVATDNGWCIGKWFPFPKPDDEPPVLKIKMSSSERVLWCPWCDDWSIFKRDGQSSRWDCTGICKWSNTDEFHVRTQNKIWFEDIPLSELRKMDIPRPSKPRR